MSAIAERIAEDYYLSQPARRVWLEDIELKVGNTRQYISLEVDYRYYADGTPYVTAIYCDGKLTSMPSQVYSFLGDALKEILS